MKPWMTALAGAVAGAVLTAIAFMVVQREPASTAAASATAGAPGGTAIGAASAASLSASADGESGQDAPGARAAMEAALTAMTHAELQRRTLALTAENRALRDEIRALGGQRASQSPEGGPVKTYDLSPEELATMAQNCELRWDMPSLGERPPTISDDELARLSLSDSERAIVNQKFAASHARLMEEVRRAYGALTGDENAGSMSADAMFAEIMDKMPKQELRAIYQRLARERAGLQPAPADPSALSPVEHLLRLITGEGDALEQALAQELGPELASDLRDLGNGWSSQFRSSHGCPE